MEISRVSIKDISDFFLHLFHDLNRRPSTIEGYRTALADTLNSDSLDISHSVELSRLLASFHRDKPKASRALPLWDLSVVLHMLTKDPFEPMRKASLKYLTLKTVFLLALASGKRRSEIHAWLPRVSKIDNWQKISIVPSIKFIAKNQLAKQGFESVAPVVIPALAPTLHEDLSDDRSLCPVRAIRYYLEATRDLRAGKDLLFVSFKKGHQGDIRPSTISSWLKQTIMFCYSSVDPKILDTLKVKAHDVRAFAASKAFYGGVSVEQIMSACHWKSHNTFTSFYLKDLAWQTDDSYSLGSVVVAQQVVSAPTSGDVGSS